MTHAEAARLRESREYDRTNPQLYTIRCDGCQKEYSLLEDPGRVPLAFDAVTERMLCRSCAGGLVARACGSNFPHATKRDDPLLAKQNSAWWQKSWADRKRLDEALRRAMVNVRRLELRQKGHP